MIANPSQDAALSSLLQVFPVSRSSKLNFYSQGSEHQDHVSFNYPGKVSNTSVICQVNNPCMEAGCSDLCLLAPVSHPLGYACACPQDKMLAPNGHACEQVLKQHTLLVGAGGSLYEIEHQRLGRITKSAIPLHNVYKITAIAYDALTGL